MIPPILRGPKDRLTDVPPAEYLEHSSERYPHLDPDFVRQIFYDHPDRFDWLFPRFDADRHRALRSMRSAHWIIANVRYDDSALLDFWHFQFDEFVQKNLATYPVFTHMLQAKTWPFPPVIIEAKFARSLGAPTTIGRPYYLVEGTHRVSYLSRMVELDLVQPDTEHEIIEIAAGAVCKTGDIA